MSNGTTVQDTIDLKANSSDVYTKTQIDTSLSTKADLVDGKVPSTQLPSYVDDIIEVANYSSLPVTGESGKIYVTLDTNLTYRWSGSDYTEISQSLALGETSSTAYRGDRGKIAYDHTFDTSNPHSVTKSQVGLSNVDNTSDVNKPISTATQTALNMKANDNSVVHLAGNETITGAKAFQLGLDVGLQTSTDSSIINFQSTDFTSQGLSFKRDGIMKGGVTYQHQSGTDDELDVMIDGTNKVYVTSKGVGVNTIPTGPLTVNGGTASSSTGENVTIYAQDSTSSTLGAGKIILKGGNGPQAGGFDIRGGTSSGNNVPVPSYIYGATGTNGSPGGQLIISAGQATGGNGGQLDLFAGHCFGTGNYSGGALNITAGNGIGTGDGGSMILSAGRAMGIGTNGDFTIRVANSNRFKVSAAGNTLVRTSTDNGVDALQVNGSISGTYLGGTTKIRGRRMIAVNTTASITPATTPTPAVFTNTQVADSMFTQANGVITFTEDCIFNSAFYVNLSCSSGTQQYFTDAEISTDGGNTWVRGTNSLRMETVRSTDFPSTRTFAYTGGFTAGQKLRFVQWGTTNTLLTTVSNNGSTSPAIRLTYNATPVKYQ